MPFFDKLGDLAKNLSEKAIEGVKNVGEKASDALEMQKLNSKINASKTAIIEEYRKIGEFYYSKYSAGTYSDPDVYDYFTNIDEQNKIIIEVQEEIERQKIEKAASQPEDSVGVPPVAPGVATVACPSCGIALPEGTRFCSECGAKVE